MITRILFTLAAALCSCSAHAGTTITEIVGKHEARDAAGKLIGQYLTHGECMAALPVPVLDKAGKIRIGTCKAVTHVDAEPNCAGVEPPKLAKFTIIDPNAVKYVLPEDNLDEPGLLRILPNGNEYTFTDVGGMRWDVLHDGSIKTELYTLTSVDRFPTCWEWQWSELKEPKPVADVGNFYMPQVDAGAYDAEKQP